jgi:hypothetical protein
MPALCRFHATFRAAAAGALFPLLGMDCGDALGPSACLSGMSFVIGTGSQPTFNWQPACGVNGLTVRAVENPDEAIWGLGSPSTSNAVRPPIQYGKIPSGLSGTATAPALVTGSAYRLTLYVWLESPVPPSQRQVLDSVDFVP